MIFDTGQVATRTEGPGTLHDFANALVWLAFPRLKARLNALHVDAQTGSRGSGRRGRVRDRATLFDESGAVVLTQNPELANLMRGFAWRELFVERRAAWPDQIRVLIVGHALLEKLRAPYKSICAQAWVLDCPTSIEDNDLDWHAARILNPESLAALTPVPLMGIPGWSNAHCDPAIMNLVITGGAGFLGQQLIGALLSRGSLAGSDRNAAEPIESITCFDQVEGALNHPRVRNVAGDIADAATVARLIGGDTRAVIHLAAVVSGTAEADFDLGMRVNVDGTRAVLEACRHAGACPRIVFSSSLAVFGGDLPAVVDDAAAPTPQGSYGVQKLIGEWLVHDYTRKGFIDGRSVRIPTVVVRPGKPNGAASGFASNILREPLAGREAVLPVPMSTRMWLTSPRSAVANLIHAASLPSSAWGWNRSLNLPGLSASMGEALAALERVGGAQARARVREQPDPAIERLVRTWPDQFDTARARSMGFVADADIEAVIRAHVADHPAG